MTSLLSLILSLIGQFLQGVNGLQHVVKASTTGLEAACLAEEAWESTRGLTVNPLVSFVVCSLGVLDQTLADYEVRGSLRMT